MAPGSENPTMQQRRFGSTDIFISPLGLGTVKLGRNQGVKYPKAFAIPDDTTAANLIALARALGINLIDTAPAYGTSEERLGHLLAGQRKDWVICTKVGEEFIDGESSFDFSAKHTRFSIERSLRRLNTDYLDIVLVHSDGDDERIIRDSDVLATLEQCRREGLVRAYGVSTKTVAGGLLAAQLTDCAMVTYHAEYTDEADVLDYCAEHRKGALIKKAFASGHLGDPNSALQFAVKHPGVGSVIVGTIDPQHLRANVAAVNLALMPAR
jgi:aryl-alcohol dehydrogenase-like predicted oxidoreductase